MRHGARIEVEGEIEPGHCPQTRRGYLYYNSGYGQNIHSHAPCQCNEIRSAYQRVLMVVGTFDEQVVKVHVKRARDKILQQLGQVARASNEELLGMFPQHRRRAYRRALDSLEVEPLSARDSHITAFVKSEKLMIQERDGDPRMIQFRSQRFNAALGAYTRPAEKRLYRLRDSNGFRVMMKGRNERQRASALRRIWESYCDPAAACFDLSRWDAHCSKQLMQISHHVWLHMHGYDNYLRSLLKQQFNNRCRTYNGVKYVCPSGVMSGDMTTACGNCLMCTLLVWGLLDWMECYYNRPMSLTFVNDGDDHCIIGERSDIHLYNQWVERWFTAAGHSLKVEGLTDNFNQILFCQSHPIYHHGVWEMMPNPRKVIATAFMVPGGHDPEDHLSQVIHMRAIIHQGQPVLGPLFMRISKLYRRPKHWDETLFISVRLGIDKRSDILWRDVEPDSRIQCFEAFGIDVTEQLEMEAMDFAKPQKTDYTRVSSLYQVRQGEMQVCLHDDEKEAN